ncbi:FtsX-like permease family protein [Gordonibacter sp. An230]|uniref:FtsX-like permease family protein n=1 Tax=Gordonibacter sp. An230 TaxID=1965592 RepID=UPI000B387987|nr:FtsX-like permease family protein [Gordonibacter sp. An230]
MSFAKRAVLYVARKRGKTLTLFLILLVIATAALSGIAVRDAAATAQLNVREALGGTFTLRQNMDDPSKWESREMNVGGVVAGTQQVFTGERITNDLGERIMGEVDGIKGFDASWSNAGVPQTLDGEFLELVSDGEDDLEDAFLQSYGDFGKTVPLTASTDTRFDAYFAKGYLELIEGEPVRHDSGDGVLVSERFAELNGLSVGDAFTLKQSSVYDSDELKDTDTVTEVRVQGIFREVAESTAGFSGWSASNTVYCTYDTLASVRPTHKDDGFDQITFHVDDPGDLGRIVEDVEASCNGSGDFTVSFDNGEVESVTAPLENMDRLVLWLVVGVLVCGAAVLALVLTARVRDRMHESGVLLSLGVPRGLIVGQYLVEAVLVAALAFAASVPLGSVAAQGLGDGLLEYASEQVANGGEGSGGGGSVRSDGATGMTVADSSSFGLDFEPNESLTDIQVLVDGRSAVIAFGAGLALVTAAVVCSSVPLLRRSPKEILGTMS